MAGFSPSLCATDFSSPPCPAFGGFTASTLQGEAGLDLSIVPELETGGAGWKAAEEDWPSYLPTKKGRRNRKPAVMNGSNPFSVLRDDFKDSTLCMPTRVLRAAKALGPEVLSKVEQFDVTETLERVGVCLEAVEERGVNFPPIMGRALLLACLEEDSEQGCDMAVQLMEHMTVDSLLKRDIHQFATCPMCMYKRPEEDIRRVSSLWIHCEHTYWKHVHSLHSSRGWSKQTEEEKDCVEEGSADSPGRLDTPVGYVQEETAEQRDSNDGTHDKLGPFLAAASKATYVPLVQSIGKLLESVPSIIMSVKQATKRYAPGLMIQWFAAFATPPALAGVVGSNFERLVTCMAAELPVTGNVHGRTLLWNGKIACYRLAYELLETLDGPELRTKLMAAMAQAIFDALREADKEMCLRNVTPLLKEAPTALKAWMGEEQMVTPATAPFHTSDWQETFCALEKVVEQATSLLLLPSLALLLEEFKVQLVALPEDKKTSLLLNAAEYGGLSAVEVFLRHLTPIALFRKLGSVTVAGMLLEGHSNDGTGRHRQARPWLHDLFDYLYNNSPDLVFAFHAETTYTPLELMVKQFFKQETTETVAWLGQLFESMEANGLDDLVDLEMAHCYAHFVWNHGQSLIDAFWRDEAGPLMTSRVVIDMMRFSAKYLKEHLVPKVTSGVYCKRDNEEGLTPLAAYAQKSDEERTLLIFNACPAAMCVELPKVGSALHCMVAASRLSLELLLHILDTLEERDFFFFEDEFGNNTLHVAALSTWDRPVIEVLRSTMPSSVASAVNKAGLSPLELYNKYAASRHGGHGDLTELFLANSMAKRAF